MPLGLTDLGTLIAPMLVLLAATETALGDVKLTLPAKNKTGLVLTVNNEPLAFVLDALSKQTGMTIRGRQYITVRPVNGQFEGDLPELLKNLMPNEDYLLDLGTADNQGYTPVETIIFVARSDLKQINSPEQVTTSKPKETEEEQRIKKAISPPPANTPERERFDKAMIRVRSELEQSLQPLKKLR
jgi:hypothetical protein